MKGIVHPFTKALYEPDGEGNIRVTDRGLIGLFGPDGRWVSGALRECDPQMCGWIAGPHLSSQRVVIEPA